MQRLLFDMKEDQQQRPTSSTSLTSNDMEKLLELQNSHLRRLQTNFPYADFGFRPNMLFADDLEANQQMLQNLLKHYQTTLMEDPTWFLKRPEEVAPVGQPSAPEDGERSRRRSSAGAGRRDEDGKLYTKQRKTNFTAKEVETLLNSVAAKKEIILFGVAGGKGWARAWQEIGREVSKVEGIDRSEGDVRKKWTYLKWEAKNTSKPGRDPVSKQVLNILTSREREVADAMNFRDESSVKEEDYDDRHKSPAKELPGVSPISGQQPPAASSTTPPVPPLIKSTNVTPPPQVLVPALVAQAPPPKRHSLPPLAPKPVVASTASVKEVKNVKPVAKAPPPPAIAVAPPPPPPAEVCLRWNSYHANMQNTFPSLLNNEQFVDVTLACDGRSIKCHKVMLSACSPYMEELLSANPCQHPIIFLKDMKFWQLAALVDFMYRGEVNVAQDKLPQLLAAAEALQIKGLASPVHPTGASQHAQDLDPETANYLRHLATPDIKTEIDDEYQPVVTPPKVKKRKLNQPSTTSKPQNESANKPREKHIDTPQAAPPPVEDEAGPPDSPNTTDYSSYKDYQDMSHNNGTNAEEDLDIDEEQAQMILERYSQNDDSYTRDTTNDDDSNENDGG